MISPFTGDEAHDVDAAVEHRHARHQALYARPRAVDVEYGYDHRVGLRRAADKVGNGVDGVALDAYEDDVGLPPVFLGGRGGDVQRVFALEVAVQLQSVLPDSGQVFAASNASHVLACQGQEGGNASAYASGSCY